MFCDHAVMCFLLIPPLIWSGIDQAPWAFWLLLAFYLNKDFLKGRSPAKRLFQLQLVDANGQPANELRCFLRNVTALLWPVEVLVLFLGRRTRLGDTLAGTYVSRVTPGAASLWQDVRTYRATRYSLYTLGATFAFLLLVHAGGTYFFGL
jgi:uncharacterized RDD family membrane protein YckC